MQSVEEALDSVCRVVLVAASGSYAGIARKRDRLSYQIFT
jgi:hypothetical protein